MGLLCLVSAGFCCFGSEWVEVGLLIVVLDCLLWFGSAWFGLSRISTVISEVKEVICVGLLQFVIPLSLVNASADRSLQSNCFSSMLQSNQHITK